MPEQIKISRGIDVDTLVPEDSIHPRDGQEKGYYGYSPETDRDQYTVAGVTGGTATTTDKPDTTAKARADKNFEPLKGSTK